MMFDYDYSHYLDNDHHTAHELVLIDCIGEDEFQDWRSSLDAGTIADDDSYEAAIDSAIAQNKHSTILDLNP